jgi:hypothetical protein
MKISGIDVTEVFNHRYSQTDPHVFEYTVDREPPQATIDAVSKLLTEDQSKHEVYNLIHEVNFVPDRNAYLHVWAWQLSTKEQPRI